MEESTGQDHRSLREWASDLAHLAVVATAVKQWDVEDRFREHFARLLFEARNAMPVPPGVVTVMAAVGELVEAAQTVADWDEVARRCSGLQDLYFQSRGPDLPGQANGGRTAAEILEGYINAGRRERQSRGPAYLFDSQRRMRVLGSALQALLRELAGRVESDVDGAGLGSGEDAVEYAVARQLLSEVDPDAAACFPPVWPWPVLPGSAGRDLLDDSDSE